MFRYIITIMVCSMAVWFDVSACHAQRNDPNAEISETYLITLTLDAGGTTRSIAFTTAGEHYYASINDINGAIQGGFYVKQNNKFLVVYELNFDRLSTGREDQESLTGTWRGSALLEKGKDVTIIKATQYTFTMRVTQYGE